MPPSETDNNLAANAPASALLAAGEDEEVPPSAHLPIQPNNQCPSKSPNGNTVKDVDSINGSEESKDGGATLPAAAKKEDTNHNNGSVAHEALPSTNTNNSQNNEDTPITLSSPRRRVKKRRSDDFVYADTKKDEKTSKVDNGAKLHASPQAKKPVQRKRPKQCPSSDSILIEVPLSVTADLGVALKRTRRKRIKRIQDWVASAPGRKPKGDNNKPAAKKKGTSTQKEKHDNDGDGSCCSGSDDDEDDGNDKDITLEYDDEALGKTPKRNQYGSVLDYLEAKYVRGVMIADYDDREQAKTSTDVQEDMDSEGDNSCYDDEDGFIDDSLMVEDVAGQVMASSTYGLTQIEEEARKRKEETKKGGGLDGDNEQTVVDLGITDDTLDDIQLDEVKESDFDDGFFVNLGDLEMAEGWSGDNVVISPTKKKRKKKRAKAAPKDKEDKQPSKKKKTTSTSSPEKKKKPTQKTDTKVPSPKKGKKTTPGKSENKQPKKKDQVTKQVKKVSPEKERAMQLRKVMKRKYNACVKMIKELTSEQLPLKQRNKKHVKLSVSIPADKSIGDEIMFANPNIPGQKLKAKIPDKADMVNRTFVASVPGPKVPSTKKENNLPKEFKEALCDYSTAYDEWCVAEEALNASLPENKRKDYKMNVERMKKFDEMITEFPKKLATPIDAVYLRAAVRRVRSNKARQEKRKSGSDSPKRRQVTEKVEINITVPQKGNDFTVLSFNKQDFQE